MDKGLHCLAIVARLHQVASDPRQLEAEYAPTSGQSEPNDVLRAAASLGFKSRACKGPMVNIDERILPVILSVGTNDYVVLSRILSPGQSESIEIKGRSALIIRPDQTAPEVVELASLGGGEPCDYIMLRPRRDKGPIAAATFNLRWFIPALLKYRAIFRDVIIASFFLQLFALATPLFFQVVMDKVLVHQGFTTLDVLAFGFFFLISFEAVIGGLRNYLFSHTATRVDVELGAKLFHHLARLPLSYFESRATGQTVARVRELETIRNFITGTALTLLIDLTFTFVFFAVLWFYSPKLTLIVLASLPVYILLSIIITPVLKQRLDTKFQHGAESQSFLTESVSGIHTLKAQALEPQMQRRWEALLADYVKSSFLAQNLNNVANQIAGLTSKITTLLIIWWGAHLVIAGAMTVGQLVAFNMIAGRIAGPILKLVQLWQDFQQAGISLQRLGDILNMPIEGGHSANRSTPSTMLGDIDFEDVSFRYRPDGSYAARHLSLKVSAGEIIGLVGRSGSGKSTIAKLLQRLYVAESGKIRIDDIDLSMLDPTWVRRSIGVVQQESFLFNRSVRDNIAIANPGVSFERVVACAKAAGAHEFILEMSEGYDTVVEEQGSNLSGGQRQRIAIARALLPNPKILILDEATSALDYESERVIQEQMGKIAKGRTVIIIAHRLSTVRHCDRIYVIDQGHVIESGTHDELLSSEGYYARLHSYQNHVPAFRTVKHVQGTGAGGSV